MKLRTAIVLGASATGAVLVALLSLWLVSYLDDSGDNSTALQDDADTNTDWVQMMMEETDQGSSQPASDTRSSSQ